MLSFSYNPINQWWKSMNTSQNQNNPNRNRNRNNNPNAKSQHGQQHKKRSNQQGQRHNKHSSNKRRPSHSRYNDDYSSGNAEKFIGEPKATYHAESIEPVDMLYKKMGLKYPKALKELNEQRKVLVTKISQAEQKLRFSQSRPLAEDLIHLKRQDTQILCQMIELIAG